MIVKYDLRNSYLYKKPEQREAGTVQFQLENMQ